MTWEDYLQGKELTHTDARTPSCCMCMLLKKIRTPEIHYFPRIMHKVLILLCLNTLRLWQNGRHFPDDIFKWIFCNENVKILIKISLKFVIKGAINNIPAMVQIMACHLLGDKPLSEPMMARLPTHICITRPQWVNESWVLATCASNIPSSRYKTGMVQLIEFNFR